MIPTTWDGLGSGFLGLVRERITREKDLRKWLALLTIRESVTPWRGLARFASKRGGEKKMATHRNLLAIIGTGESRHLSVDSMEKTMRGEAEGNLAAPP